MRRTSKKSNWFLLGAVFLVGVIAGKFVKPYLAKIPMIGGILSGGTSTNATNEEA